jgi:TonB family protein
MSSKNIKIFDETGCLSEEALTEYAHGKLDIHLRKQVEIHVNDCDFCRDALEGISLMKSKDTSRAAIAQLNEKIAGYGKPERAGGRVIQMNFLRLAAAVLIFFVLGGGVLYLAFNPPFKNQTAQKTADEKVLAENKMKEEVETSVIDDSITAGYVTVVQPDDITSEKPLMKDEANKQPLEPSAETKSAEGLFLAKPITEDVKDANFSTITATGGASNAAPSYYNPQYGNPSTPAASADMDLNIEEQNKGVSASYNAQTKSLSEVEVTSARSESKANDKKAKKESAKNEKAATVMQSEADAGSFVDDALKVAEDKEEVEQARKKVEDEAGSQNTDTKVYAFVEEMPQYPGGNEALKKYIRDNVNYPQSAKEQAISGTVYISYVVTETGKVTKVKVWKSVNKDLDNEAVRVVSSLKDFTPGKQAGKQVAVQMTVPVKFSLE